MELVGHRVESAICTEAEGIDPRQGRVCDDLPVSTIRAYHTDAIA
jgi:hypothetical protein